MEEITGYVFYEREHATLFWLMFVEMAPLLMILMGIFYKYSLPSISVGILLGLVIFLVYYLNDYGDSRYIINEAGIFLQCRKSRKNRNIPWEEIKILSAEMMEVPYYGRFLRKEYYYLVSRDFNFEVKEEIMENLKCPAVICIPRTEEVLKCLEYYVPRLTGCTKCIL